MDPLTALSLSCNILDLIERAVKCALLVKKLHDGASMEVGEDAETVYDTMQGVITALGDKSGRPLLKPKLQTSMDNILAQCEELCRALEKVLCKCKPAKKSSWRSAGAAAIRIVMSKSDIESLERKLKEQRTALGMLEIAIIRDGIEKTNQLLDHVNLKENRISTQLEGIHEKVEDGIGPLREKLDEVLSQMKTSDEKIKHHSIMTSLDFASMDARFNEVHEPGSGTLNWIYDDHERLIREERTLGITLTDWLHHGSGIFHIVGKAGSGKSTLLKFVYEMPRTAKLLQTWAQSDNKQLVLCQFFFWRVTMIREKKTLKGLIRGLLHNILSQVPELSPILFPNLWQQRLSASGGNISFRITDREVATAFETLMESDTIYDKLQIRLCFLIDGLDEFEEDVALQRETYRDLAIKLRKWAYNPFHRHMKMCVTSRPLAEFTSVFEASQRITLEKHTKADIEKYVHDELELNELFQELGRSSRGNALNCDFIPLEVIYRADGVFLWVVLVIQLLKQELSTGASAQSLLNIVASSNPALNLFFEQIIHSIPHRHRLASFYLLAASMHLSGYFITPERNFRLFESFQEKRPQLIWTKLDLWDSATIFELGDKHPQDFLDFDRHTEIPVVEMVDGDARDEIEQKRLASRCRGLLEFQNGKLVFIHRAIPEVLQEYFRQERQTEVEDQKVSEMLAWIALARVTKDPPTSPSPQRHSIIGILTHLRLRDLDGCESLFRILQHIDKVLIPTKEHRGPKEHPWKRLHAENRLLFKLDIYEGNTKEYWFRSSFPDVISLCQQCGLYEYVCWGLDEFLQKPENRDRTLRLLTDSVLNLASRDSLLSLTHQKIIDAMVLTGFNLETLKGEENNENGKTEAGALWYEFIGRELHFWATGHSELELEPESRFLIKSPSGINWRGIEAFLRLGADADILLVQTYNAGGIVGPQGNILFTVSEDYYKSHDFIYSKPRLVRLPRSPISLRDFVAYQARHHDVRNSELLLELIDRSIMEKRSLKQSTQRSVSVEISQSLVVVLFAVLLNLLVYRFGTWGNLGLKGFMV